MQVETRENIERILNKKRVDSCILGAELDAAFYFGLTNEQGFTPEREEIFNTGAQVFDNYKETIDEFISNVKGKIIPVISKKDYTNINDFVQDIISFSEFKDLDIKSDYEIKPELEKQKFTSNQDYFETLYAAVKTEDITLTITYQDSPLSGKDLASGRKSAANISFSSEIGTNSDYSISSEEHVFDIYTENTNHYVNTLKELGCEVIQTYNENKTTTKIQIKKVNDAPLIVRHQTDVGNIVYKVKVDDNTSHPETLENEFIKLNNLLIGAGAITESDFHHENKPLITVLRNFEEFGLYKGEFKKI